jgi:hypothetical protein
LGGAGVAGAAGASGADFACSVAPGAVTSVLLFSSAKIKLADPTNAIRMMTAMKILFINTSLYFFQVNKIGEADYSTNF